MADQETKAPKLTRLDRFMREVAPGKAVQRLANKQRFDVMTGAYSGTSFDGAKTNDIRRNHPAWKRLFDRTEDAALPQLDRHALILNVRDMKRNRGVVAGLFNRFANGVVGTGLQAVPETKSKTWNKLTADWWIEYQKNPDSRRRLKAWEMERLTVKSRMGPGECFFVKTSNGQLQPIESTRVQTPKQLRAEEGKTVVQGIKVTPKGVPVGIFVCDRKKGGRVDNSTARFVRWQHVIHPAIIERWDQLRADPPLSPVVNRLRDQGKLVESTLLRSVQDSMRAWAVMSDEDIQEENMGDRTATQTTTEGGILVEKSDMAETWYLDKNGKMQSLESKTPNNQYPLFNRGLLTEIAMAVDIPYEVLMLDLAKASFSGGHGITRLAYETWAIWRFWLVQELLTPWWNWRVGMAIVNAELPPAPVDAAGVSEWHKVGWAPPERFYWDPKGAATANKLNIDMGLSSHIGILRSQGMNLKTVMAETGEAIEAAIKEAKRIEKKTGIPVPWQSILNPGGTSTASAEPVDRDEDTIAREAELAGSTANNDEDQSGENSE